MTLKLDHIDYRILEELQRDASQSQRALSEKVGLSQNACWRRLKALDAAGVIRNHTVVLDRTQLGAGLVVFVMIKTRHHSASWLKRFRTHVSSIADVIDFFRIADTAKNQHRKDVHLGECAVRSDKSTLPLRRCVGV